MAAAGPAGPVLGRLSDFADRTAVSASYREGGREVAVLVVRRGDELRAFLDLCPHQCLPLTWRGRRVLSGTPFKVSWPWPGRGRERLPRGRVRLRRRHSLSSLRV